MRVDSQNPFGAARGWVVASLIVLSMGVSGRATAADSPYVPTMKDMMSIQTAMQRYHEGLDKQDNHLMASAFWNDATLILEAPDREVRVHGRDKIAAGGFFAGLPPPPSASAARAPGGQPPGAGGAQGAKSPAGEPPNIWHFSANDYYEFESPTRVRHSAYWLDVIPGTGREASVGTPGRYEDILVKRHGEWLFLERRIIVGRK